MRGEDTFAGKPWDCLRSLETTNQGWVKHVGEYSKGLSIVGQQYRAEEAQKALSRKKTGNMALLAREIMQ